MLTTPHTVILKLGWWDFFERTLFVLSAGHHQTGFLESSPPLPPFFFSFKNHMHMDVHIQSRSTAETGKNILLSSCYGGFLAVVSSTYCSELLKCDSSGGQAAFPSAVWQIVPELCKPTGLSLFWIQNQFCWWWWKQNRGHLEKCGWALRHHFKKQ